MTSWLRGLAIMLGAAFLVGVAMTGAPSQARADPAICDSAVAPAGASVSSLGGESLGQLDGSVAALDCDDSYYLVPWGDGVGVVRRPAPAKRTGAAAPNCDENSTSDACLVRRALVSKYEEWRRRYGTGRPKKK